MQPQTIAHMDSFGYSLKINRELYIKDIETASAQISWKALLHATKKPFKIKNTVQMRPQGLEKKLWRGKDNE